MLGIAIYNRDLHLQKSFARLPVTIGTANSGMEGSSMPPSPSNCERSSDANPSIAMDRWVETACLRHGTIYSGGVVGPH